MVSGSKQIDSRKMPERMPGRDRQYRIKTEDGRSLILNRKFLHQRLTEDMIDETVHQQQCEREEIGSTEVTHNVVPDSEISLDIPDPEPSVMVERQDNEDKVDIPNSDLGYTRTRYGRLVKPPQYYGRGEM